MRRMSMRGIKAGGLLALVMAFVGHPLVAWSDTSVTTSGITFNFDGDYQTGRFVDGEPWVVENTAGQGVRIVSMNPPYSNGHHGYDVNRTAAELRGQSLDDRIGTSFSAPPSLPRTFAANDSILKVISYDIDTGGCDRSTSYKTCLKQASVLTVLATRPPTNSFRPPYFGTDKPIFSADIDLGVLPKVPEVPGQVSIASAEAVFNGVWLDHIEGSRNRYGHPGDAMRTPGGGGAAAYGTRLAISITVAILRTMHNDASEEKRTLVNEAVQFGIDTYYLAINGKTWPANGGIHMGRKAPILYAGFLLRNQDMLNIGRTHGGNIFQEDGMTYISSVHGEALWGELDCSSGKYDRWINSGSGGKACADPAELVDGSRCMAGTYCSAHGGPGIPQPSLSVQRSTGLMSVGNYQRYTSMYFGVAAIGRLLHLEADWNHPAFFAYTDRMGSPPWNYYCGAYCNTYLAEMHKAYGGPGEAPPLPEPGQPPAGQVPPPILLSE